MLGHRAKNTLALAKVKWPGAWKAIDQIREGQKHLWPDHIFAPLGKVGDYLLLADKPKYSNKYGAFQVAADAASLGSLAAWRPTQGIYRFDPELYQELIQTPVTGDLPCELFRRMPEWCLYVEAPGLAPATMPEVFGFWVWIEWDTKTEQEELRFLLDCPENIIPSVIHLGPWTLQEAVNKFYERANKNGLSEILKKNRKMAENMATVVKEEGILIEKFISLLLYIVSQPGEITGDGQPGQLIEGKARRSGKRLFAPDQPKLWGVGVRMGAALKAAKARAESEGGGPVEQCDHIFAVLTGTAFGLAPERESGSWL